MTGTGSQYFYSTTEFGTTFTPSGGGVQYYVTQSGVPSYPNTDDVAFYVPINGTELTYKWMPADGQCKVYTLCLDTASTGSFYVDPAASGITWQSSSNICVADSGTVTNC